MSRGSVVTLPAGTFGFDTAGTPNYAQARNEGHQFVIGYVSIPVGVFKTTRNPKDVSDKELEDGAEAGFGWGFSVEQSSDTALKGWSDTALHLMDVAQDRMDHFDAPNTVPLLWNNDTDAATDAACSQVARSMEAAHSRNRRGHPIGLYGGAKVIKFCDDRGLVTGPRWRSNATSWDHGVNCDEHIKQSMHTIPKGWKTAIDPDRLVRPTPFWFPHQDPALPPDPIPPVPEIIPTKKVEDDMPAVAPFMFHCNTGQVGVRYDGTEFSCPGDGTVFMADGRRQTYRWVTVATAGDDAFASGVMGGDAALPGSKVDNLEAMGVLVGRVPHL